MRDTIKHDWLIAAGCVLFLAVPQAFPAKKYDYAVKAAFPQLQFDKPLYLASPQDGTHRLFVVEQDGRISWFENRENASEAHLVLDLGPKVRREHMEEGLLGFAFHPNFKTNHQFFIQYSATPRRNVISRFTMDSSNSEAIPESEEILIEIQQPYGNHNGGMLDFGPDKYLYVSLGDGGAGGDPHDNGQNLKTLLGKILRIDVDHKNKGLEYSIPPDNPFVQAAASVKKEIWAYGLRNPWRFSFDRKTGKLWAGDVGQDAWEEIDVIEKGKNYGWNRREGRHPFDAKRSPAEPYAEPVVEHGRDVAQSITGGYVYRGKKLKDLLGFYIYGDFVTGNIWAFNAGLKGKPAIIAKGTAISSFGEDENGEIYFTSYDGKIYRLEKNRN